jgi:hypothetical protein
MNKIKKDVIYFQTKIDCVKQSEIVEIKRHRFEGKNLFEQARIWAKSNIVGV